MLTGGSSLHRIASALPELASDDVIARAMARIRPGLLADIRRRQGALFAQRTGTMRKSIGVSTTPRGLSAKVAKRAFYARLWEGSKRRPFVGPAVDAFDDLAALEIAREIEGVRL